MKTIKGTPYFINKNSLGRTQRKGFSFSDNIVLLGETPLFMGKNTIALLPDTIIPPPNRKVIVIPFADFEPLNEGDILQIKENGTINVLWEELAHDNVIFMTDFCNSSCIMCPQVPEGIPYSYYEQCRQMISLVKKSNNLKFIGITGGEPTIFADEIVQILQLCMRKFPATPIALLTNGKNFDDFNFAKKCVITNQNVTYCIPLYASYARKHDYIVGSKGSFQRTINGIYNLIRLKSKIEIRIVLIKDNYLELPLLIDYIYQNMPFVVHVAIMGMESTGLAEKNLTSLWIDPHEYGDILTQSAKMLKRSGLSFSIYNIPRCILPKNLWGFDRDSISSWKKKYELCCDECLEKEFCCGLFNTSIRQSNYIRPIRTK